MFVISAAVDQTDTSLSAEERLDCRIQNFDLVELIIKKWPVQESCALNLNNAETPSTNFTFECSIPTTRQEANSSVIDKMMIVHFFAEQNSH